MHPSKLKTVMAISMAVIFSSASIAHADKMTESVHKPVESHQWFDTGVGAMQAAVAYGDMTKGGHGTILKMPKGFSSPVHKHSNEYHSVVISGTVVNSEVGKPDIKMNAGSYWYQVGDANHVTRCVSDKGCMVFLMQPEKFDFITEK